MTHYWKQIMTKLNEIANNVSFPFGRLNIVPTLAHSTRMETKWQWELIYVLAIDGLRWHRCRWIDTAEEWTKWNSDLEGLGDRWMSKTWPCDWKTLDLKSGSCHNVQNLTISILHLMDFLVNFCVFFFCGNEIERFCDDSVLVWWASSVFNFQALCVFVCLVVHWRLARSGCLDSRGFHPVIQTLRELFKINQEFSFFSNSTEKII